MKNKKTESNMLFWVCEAILLAAAAFFAFAMVGYTTIALLLAAAALLVALYKLIRRFAKRNRKAAGALKNVLTTLVCLALAGFIAVEVPIIAAARTDENPEAPYLIVLGAGVNGTQPSLSLLNRLEAAKDYLEAYPDSIAVVSGGQGPGEDITEALCMKDWLTENGVSPDRILMEPEATSTYDNLRLSLEMISENGGDPEGKVAIVSSEYHLYRAKYMASELGAQPLGVAGRTSYPVLMVNYFIREAAAVLVTWIM